MADKVVVAQRDFIDAVSALPKMKRGPRGSFSNKIPTDTLLYCSEGRLVVFTPAKRTVMGMAGEWSVCVSTDAWRLALLCSKLKASDFIAVVYSDGFIVLNEPAFSVPGKPSPRPEGE